MPGDLPEDGVLGEELSVKIEGHLGPWCCCEVGPGAPPGAGIGARRRRQWARVCRGSASRVVNIQGGSGVVAVLRADVARDIARAMAR